MLGKKKYIMILGFLMISGSFLTWILYNSDFSRNVPIRAKQVFFKNSIEYKSTNYVQTRDGVVSFNEGGREYGCKSD